MIHYRRPLVFATSVILASLAGFVCAYGAILSNDMGREQAKKWHKADDELNRYYRTLRATPMNPITKHKLIASERAWVKYRDTEANFEASVLREGGAEYDFMLGTSLEDLTEEREKQLKEVMSHINGY